MAELWILAYPVIVATLSQSVMGVVDTFYMGRIGTTEQGAVGFAALIFWTVSSLFVGTQQGVSTFAAQLYGAGDFTRCGRDGWIGLFISVPSAAILAVIALFTVEIFELIQTGTHVGASGEGSIIPHASNYLSIRLFGSLFILINLGVTNFLRGIGDTKTPMYFTIGANVLNVLLDYWLILAEGGPHLGATGAALGSVIATGVFSLAYMAFFLSGRCHRRFATRRIQVPRLREMLDFLKIGAPIGGTWALEMIAWTVFMGMVSRLGNMALASTIIVFEVLHFSFMVAVSIGTAATTLVGQYLGAEDPKTAQKTARSALISGVVYCVTMGLLFLFMRRIIMSTFSLDPEVIETGCRLFIYAAVFQFFDGLGISSNGVIRGAGDTRFPLYLTVFLAVLFFIPLTYLLTWKADLGIDGHGSPPPSS